MSPLYLPYTRYPFHLQTRCEEANCKADLKDPCGHVTCRAHSYCAFEVDGVLVWYPEGCEVCYSFWDSLTNPQSSQESKELARRSFRTCAGGFGRSSTGKPYLLTDDLRTTLFPKAPNTAVVAEDKAAPIIASVRSNIQGLDTGLRHIDLSLEQMEDISGEGYQVGGQPSVDSTTFRVISQPSPVPESSSSFSGFKPASNVVTKAKLKCFPRLSLVRPKTS